MSAQTPPYRRATFNRFTSSEELDVLMRVTSPRGWLALAVIAGLLAGALVWSVVGSIPTRLLGQGMLLRGGALREIRASGSGVLEELYLTQGATVHIGTLVGRIRGAEIIAAAEAWEHDDRPMPDAFAVRLRLTGLQHVAERRGARVASRQEAPRSAKRFWAAQRVPAANPRARGQEQEDVERCLTQEAKVVNVESGVAGRIIEVRARRGDTVHAGQTLAVVEPENAPIQSLVYFDARTAKQIRPGMEAQISPTDIKREEYGFIKGTVQSVGQGPVSIEKVRQDLANQALAQEIYGQTAKIEVRVTLNESRTTPSGLEWSSRVGPARAISSNTRVTVAVVVDRQPPYTLVLPAVRRALGAS